MNKRIIGILVLMGLCLSGMAALVYEVVWTRALSLVMGSSTYALSTMLTSFMAGLTIGGYFGGLWADRTRRPVYAFGLLEVGIAISGSAIFIVIKNLSPIYAWIFYKFHLSFSSFSIAQFVLSFLIMLIPTTLMGATFPMALKIRAKRLDTLGREAGDVYAINNLGAIIGSFAAGFILVPLLGSTGAILLAGFINLLVGCTILLCDSRAWKATGYGILTFVGILFFVTYIHDQFPFSYYTAERWGSYSNFALARERSQLLFHKEGVVADVMLFGGKPPILISGGKPEGGETLFHPLIAYLSLASHPTPNDVLSIGLGSGNTLSAITKMPIKKVDSVEISPEIMEVTSRFIRPELFFDPKITHIVADARNFLFLTPKKYDAIISVPSWPVEFAAASLLTKEFFSLADQHLNKNGIFAQWIDYYLFTKEDMQTFIRTFTSIFPYTTVWHTSGKIVILTGSKEPFAYSPEEIKAKVEVAAPELEDTFILGMTDEDIHKTPWWSTGRLNTDDHPILEFHISKAAVIGENAVRGLTMN